MQQKGDKKKTNSTEKKKMSKKKKILLSVGIVFLLIILGIGGTYMYIRGHIYQGNTSGEEVTYEEQPGITNILLIGTDARKLNEAARADAIIIATIDNNNKKLKLTSIMRDTLVNIPGHGEQKINAALAFGGPDLLMKTIKENFNLSLNKYVMVNFNGFTSIINAVGGIDVDVHDYEIKELNKFIGEYEKVKSPKIEKPGMQHLDGQQALAYARIRKVGDGDYERTERQRRVIDLVTQKFKDLSVIKYPSVMGELLPYVKTNIEPAMILNYAYTVSKFPSLTFEQLRIPVSDDISWGGLYKDKGWVLIIDKEQCSKIMDDFIFNNKKPTKDSYNIEKWKSKLEQYMGANEEHIKDNGPLQEKDEDYIPPISNSKTEIKPNNNTGSGSGNSNSSINHNKKPSTNSNTNKKPSSGSTSGNTNSGTTPNKKPSSGSTSGSGNTNSNNQTNTDKNPGNNTNHHNNNNNNTGSGSNVESGNKPNSGNESGLGNGTNDQNSDKVSNTQKHI